MTLTSGFFNSVNSDRKYSAVEMSHFFDGILTDGVLQGFGSAFKLLASSQQVILGSGRAWFRSTWTYNDGPLPIDILASSPINNRVDTLVLEVNKSLPVRENTIKFIEGTPSTAPVPPTLVNTEEIRQYPLHYVKRPRGIEVVQQTDITSAVGTSDCPYAANALIDLEKYDVLSYKRSTVRGANLGSTFTAEQRQAIKDGSFDGLYLGDYWVHQGVNWRIVDFDYWLGRQETENPNVRVDKHHIVIMPDDVRPMFANIRPFTSNRTAGNCGFYHSIAGRKRCNDIADRSKQIFGTGRILRRIVTLPTNLAIQRFAMNNLRVSEQATPPTEYMLIGARNMGIPSTQHETQQLALFAQNERYIWMGHDRGEVTNIPTDRGSLYGAFWTMQQYVVEGWVCQHDWLGSTHHDPSALAVDNDHQFRPVFGVTGV